MDAFSDRARANLGIWFGISALILAGAGGLVVRYRSPPFLLLSSSIRIGLFQNDGGL